MKTFVKIILAFLIAGSASAETHVTVNLSAIAGLAGSVTTNRTCFVQELSVPGVLGNSIRIGPITKFITDSNSSFTVSNCAISVYGVTVKAPPDTTYFEFNVTATNLGTIFAGPNTSVSGAATYPPGAVAWSAAASDLRYGLSTNVLGTAAFVSTTNFQPANLNLSNWAQLSTNAIALANNLGTIASRSSNDFYLASNPGGYVTASITNTFATTNFAGFQVASGNLTSWSALSPGAFVLGSAVGTIASRSSNDFYLASNPNGYIRTNDLAAYAATNYAGFQTSSLNLSNWANAPTNLYALSNSLGSAAFSNSTAFYPANNPSNFVTTNYTGFQAASGNLTSWSALSPGLYVLGSAVGTIASHSSNDFYLASNPNGYVTASITNTFATTNYPGFQGANANLSNWAAAPTNLYALSNSLGTAAFSNATAFYPASNPSNFITAAQGGGIATNYSGFLSFTNTTNTFVGTFTGSGAGLTGITASATNINTNVLATTNDGRALTHTNPLNVFIGTFTGNGAAVTNLSTTALTGTLQSAQVPANLVTSNFAGFVSFANTTNTFAGTFTGNGGALTNLNVLAITNLDTNSFMRTDEHREVSFVNQVDLGEGAFIDGTGSATLNGLVVTAVGGGEFFLDTAGNVTANSYTGNGAGLSGIPASAIPSINTNFFSLTNDTRTLVHTNAANSFAGSFTGNGLNLTNIPLAAIPLLNTNAFFASSSGKGTNITLAGTNTFTGVELYPQFVNSTLISGNNAAINLNSNHFIRFTGPTGPYTNLGFAGGANGRWFVGMSDVAQTMVLVNDSTQEAVGNRIFIAGGGPLVMSNRYSMFMAWYDANSSHWIISSSQGASVSLSGAFTGSFTGDGSGLTNVSAFGTNGGWALTGNSGTTINNFIGTTEDFAQMTIKAASAAAIEIRPVNSRGPNLLVGGRAGGLFYSGFSNNVIYTTNSSGLFANSILGGENNTIVNNSGSSIASSVIAGGYTNTITNSGYGAVGGGLSNIITGFFGTIPGGSFNTAAQSSFAAGTQAQAINVDSFVWSDGVPFGTTAPNQFLIRATGGVGINTNAPGTNALSVQGNILATRFTGNGGGLTNLTLPSTGNLTNLGTLTITTNATTDNLRLQFIGTNLNSIVFSTNSDGSIQDGINYIPPAAHSGYAEVGMNAPRITIAAGAEVTGAQGAVQLGWAQVGTSNSVQTRWYLNPSKYAWANDVLGYGSIWMWYFTYYNQNVGSVTTDSIAQRAEAFGTNGGGIINYMYPTFAAKNGPVGGPAYNETPGISAFEIHGGPNAGDSGIAVHGHVINDVATPVLADTNYGINFDLTNEVFLSIINPLNLTNVPAVHPRTNQANSVELFVQTQFSSAAISWPTNWHPGTNVPTTLGASNIYEFCIHQQVMNTGTNITIHLIDSYAYTPVQDPATIAFFAASGITNAATNIAAINNLVLGLKALGEWTNLDAIYPLLGTNATQQKWNLKNTNLYNLTFGGTGIYTNNGYTSDGSSGYADTGFAPASATSPNYTLNSATIAMYNATATPTFTGVAQQFFMGGRGGGSCGLYMQNSANWMGSEGLNDAKNTASGGPSIGSMTNFIGFFAQTRTSSAGCSMFGPLGTASTDANASTAVTTQTILIGAGNNGGADHFINARFGIALIGGGETQTRFNAVSQLVAIYLATIAHQ